MEIQSEDVLRSSFSIAIIGGGFSGAVLAAQLLRRADRSFSVAVVEKTATVGRGLAYGTQCHSLLLNVRARNMSAFVDDPHHFLRWAQSNYDPATGPGSFLPRAVYGRYVESVLDQAEASAGKARLRWFRDEAVAVRPAGTGEMEVQLRSGRRLAADRIVLAQGNFPARDPLSAGEVKDESRYHRNPWSPGVFDDAESLGNVLLIGSGLTSIDVAIQLRVHRCRGTIHVLSRRGLFPQPHKATDAGPPFWNESSPRNMRGLLRLVRQEVAKAQPQGVQWQSVFDSLRPLVAPIWESLPDPEKRRFLRHVRPYWEIHRHRAAPEIAGIIESQISSGQMKVHAGRITNCREAGGLVEVTYLNRKTARRNDLRVDRVINCTGPETDYRGLDDPLIHSLLAGGLARPDSLFLGLDTSSDGALIDEAGHLSDCLYAIGPARKGTLWESTAVPELRGQIHKLAEHLLARLETKVC